MAQRRFHYEQAFEQYLRANGLPYVAVDEARKALDAGGGPHGLDAATTPFGTAVPLKSFDFIVYTQQRNLLVDIKGRHVRGRLRPGRRLENWVTREDVASIMRWEALFGDGFEAVFVFAYAFDMQPPDGWFEEVIVAGPTSGPADQRRWYALEEVCVSTYRRHMVDRSGRWQTVEVPQPTMQQLTRPLAVRRSASTRPIPPPARSRRPACRPHRPAVCSTA